MSALPNKVIQVCAMFCLAPASTYKLLQQHFGLDDVDLVVS